MAEKKVTIMVIRVDLECEKCHKKIKKVLCRIPQIQSQIYDTKAGTVTITVVCCSPEKIKEKIIYKGGEAVKSINEIKVPEKPKPAPEKKPKEEEKKEEEKRKQPGEPTDKVDGNGKPEGSHKPKALIVEPSKPNEPEKLKVVNVEPVHPRTYCADCYRGISGGPCFHDYGRPAPSCYEAYGPPVYDSWSGGGGGCGCQRSGYYACRCEYVCEDNPSSCTIM